MSHQLGCLVSEIIGRHFGDIVQKVGYDLFIYGSKPVVMIVKTTELPRVQVVESLRALLKYDLVTFEPSKNETVADYRLHVDNVLLLIRYPRYLLQIKTKYGNEAEMVIEEMLLNGLVTSTGLILSLARKYKDNKEKNVTVISVKDMFICLATAGYVQQAPVPEVREGCDVPTLVPVATIVPDVDTRSLMQALVSGDIVEDNVYWKVNFDRFHQDFRDDIMVTAISRLIDDNAGELMRQLLLTTSVRTEARAPVSAPVSQLELRDCCLAPPPLMQHFAQYLKLLEENGGGLVRRNGDEGGGQYAVCLRSAAAAATWQLLDHSVTEKLGSKAARIFRLIRTKRYIEEEDIQKQAMLPDKECKRLTYQLMDEHFISVRPMRKPASSGTLAKAIYLYYINLHEVSQLLLQWCHRALHHCGRRAAAERAGAGRLLAKRRRVQTIVHGMRLRNEPQRHLDDMEETITPPERQLLKNVDKKLKQLSQAELELDKSLFILNWYFTYTTHL